MSVIKKGDFRKLTDIHYCIRCKKVTDLVPDGGLACISEHKCSVCNLGVRVNYLDDADLDDSLYLPVGIADITSEQTEVILAADRVKFCGAKYFTPMFIVGGFLCNDEPIISGDSRVLGTLRGFIPSSITLEPQRSPGLNP